MSYLPTGHRRKRKLFPYIENSLITRRARSALILNRIEKQTFQYNNILFIFIPFLLFPYESRTKLGMRHAVEKHFNFMGMFEFERKSCMHPNFVLFRTRETTNGRGIL